MENGQNNLQRDNFADDANLNEENWQKSLEISVPTDLPTPEELSRKASGMLSEQPALNPKESQSKTPDISVQSVETEEPVNLGQISTVSSQSATGVLSEPSFNKDNIGFEGDHLSRSAIAEIDNSISELNQTRNLSNFYEEIRSMADTYQDKIGFKGENQ
ncbi:hypothetical protein IJ076_02090 [Candidatus Saccharibacteria bacterium]|nr:hypothetical protein [Candidatus Saccharibacteria bacterium]